MLIAGLRTQVAVPRFAVGIVIGRNGEMIKKIQNDAGVRIQFKPGQCSQPHVCAALAYIYVYAFSRRFYPKRLTVHSGYTNFVSTCVSWESNPQPFALLTQCSTTEPQECNLLAN